ncbi:MAG: glycoside hydrolase family 92 protein [Maribacter sp.]|nr:glycoside hydrolase family 92 protein [Maribacter sp.]
MIKIRFVLPLVVLLLISSCLPKEVAQEQREVVDYVDPFIGTGGHGHTYPGATSPFGRLQPSPDNGTTGWDWCSGYHISDSIISGFGQLHLSGTGIGDLADILVMPTNKKMDLSLFGKSRDSLPYTSKFSHDGEVASPGYYKVLLQEPKTKVELTANDYVAVHKYTFNEAKIPSFIIDLGYAVNWDKPVESHLMIEGDNRIAGHRFSTGWAKNQKVYFALETSNPIIDYQLVGDDLVSKQQNEMKGTKGGGQFYFENGTKEIEIRVAVSSVSIANAKENLKFQAELNFDDTLQKTNDTWNSLLSNITIETPTDSLKTIFYTALYHAQLAPTIFSDLNGEFRLQNDSISKAEDFKAYSTLSLWDVFRAQMPMLSILHPDKLNDIIKSMLVYYDEKGSLPVWTLSGNETDTMTGYHSVSVIAEAFLKGIRGYDVAKAYEAVYNTMMGNERGLAPYKKYGFIPYDQLDESVTISLEFAYNDWCVSQMAKALGKEEDHNYFKNRAKAYEHIFDATTKFMRGKAADNKTWRIPFDPKHSNHRVDTDYTEGNAWQHSWFVLHDVEGLIDLHGGNGPFSTMAEQLFTESSEMTGDNVSADISGLIGQYAHGNEPSHHIAYMLNKADKPWRTQYWVREILNTQYNTQPDGLSGNEDCGQMSAWYVMSAMGIYPMNPASGEYEIGSPLFEKVTLKLPEEKVFVISAPDTSDKNIYVQSVKLNGEILNRTYILHYELMAGGTLDFDMGPLPNENWGIQDKAE